MEAGEGSSAVEQAVSAAEVALDQTLLKLFHAAVRGDRLQQALEAACQLSQVKSLEGAIKLANHNRQTALANRIAVFLQTRLELEAAEEADQVQSPLQPHRSIRMRAQLRCVGHTCPPILFIMHHEHAPLTCNDMHHQHASLP